MFPFVYFPWALWLPVKFHLKPLSLGQGKHRNRTALPTLGQRKKELGLGKGAEGEALNQESGCSTSSATHWLHELGLLTYPPQV